MPKPTKVAEPKNPYRFAIIGGTVGTACIMSALALYVSGVFSKAEPPSVPAAEVASSIVQPVEAKTSSESTTEAGPDVAENTLALHWMPAETEAVLHLKISKLADAPLLTGLLESPQVASVVEVIENVIGLSLKEIESINIGSSDLNRLQTIAMAQFMGFRSLSFPGKTVIVVRSLKDVSGAELAKTLTGYELAERNGKSYLRSSNPEAPSVWVADPTTILVASPDEMKTLLDWGQTSDPRKELKLIEPSSHVVLVVAPKAPEEWVDSIASRPTSDTPFEIAEMQKSLSDSFTGLGMALTVKGGFDLQTQIALDSPSAIRKVDTGISKVLADARTLLDQSKTSAPTVITDLVELLLQNMKVEQQGQKIQISSSIPDSAQSQLEQIPPILMLMALPKASSGQRGRLPDLAPAKR